MDDLPVSSIDELIPRMEALLKPLVAAGDRRRFFHATYIRTTRGFREEIDRRGFLDNEWTERWDLAFASLYLEALDRWNDGEAPSAPWTIAFQATAEPLVPLRHVLLGINAHVNYDLPQALLAVITDEEFDDPVVVARRSADHRHSDEVLARRVGGEDRVLKAEAETGSLALVDRLLTPLNRLGTKRFLRESREKVWHNARILSAARRRGPEALNAKLRELEDLSAARVADLRAPGQVLLKLAARGFGVKLPP